MKITGAASHFAKITAMMPTKIKKYFGQLFLKLKSLNFKLIIGMFDTIR